MTFAEAQERAQTTARTKGWTEEFERVAALGDESWRLQAAFIAEKLALVHSEISEALEELRNSRSIEELRHVWYGEAGKPEGFMVELADAHIRLLNLASMIGGTTSGVVEEKLTYNETRPYKHGGRTL